MSLMPDAAANATPHLASFVAIDFETADPGADSACAVGLVKVVDNRIVDQRKYLLGWRQDVDRP